jgi:hypothetical protein
MIYKYDWTGEDAIAWLRLARSGSVIGPQQLFLTKIGEVIQNWKHDLNFSRRLTEFGFEGRQKRLARFGDKGQAEMLLELREMYSVSLADTQASLDAVSEGSESDQDELPPSVPIS